jgi:hypothetical protein
MKRVLVTAVAAGFLSVLVLGCGEKGTTTSKMSGSTEATGAGKGMMSTAATTKESESTKK